MSSPSIEDRLRSHYQLRTRHLPHDPPAYVEATTPSYASFETGRPRRPGRWAAVAALVIVVAGTATVLASGDAGRPEVPGQPATVNGGTTTSMLYSTVVPTRRTADFDAAVHAAADRRGWSLSRLRAEERAVPTPRVSLTLTDGAGTLVATVMDRADGSADEFRTMIGPGTSTPDGEVFVAADDQQARSVYLLTARSVLYVRSEQPTAARPLADLTSLLSDLARLLTPGGSRADVASGDLLLVKPEGWYAEIDTQFANVVREQKDGSVSVATFPIDELSFTGKECDEPVEVLEQLGPNDVFVSLRYAHPVEGVPTRPLTVADLMPVPVEPNLALLRCLQRGADFSWQNTNVRLGDQKVRVSVAAGLDATQASRERLTEVLTAIVARYG